MRLVPRDSGCIPDWTTSKFLRNLLSEVSWVLLACIEYILVNIIAIIN